MYGWTARADPAVCGCGTWKTGGFFSRFFKCHRFVTFGAEFSGNFLWLVTFPGTPQTGQGHLRRRAAVSGLLGTDGFLKWQAPDPIPDGVQNAEPVPQKSPASADPWAAFGKAVGYRREVCGRTHPDNLHQPDSE